ncbi:tetratricopeptide repeat protein [Treponema sp.]|uniref:tetratricopeptide repeat protein n=1 Tax=Treponema sp. TaxID=166 RepID=UPI003EFC0C01
MSKKLLCAVLCCFAAAVFICSCSSHSEGSSFTSALDSVDAAISQSLSGDAIRYLKKLEKKAYGSYEYLGIVKRYILLGESEAAERVLKKGLKKNPENPDISAVYADFLLRRNRVEEAFKISSCLKDSAYASFYAECVLRKALDAVENGSPVLETAFHPALPKKKRAAVSVQQEEDPVQFFFYPEFIPIYKSAFDGSRDSIWIFNAASILMRSGKYTDAAALYPGTITSCLESLFWGCVFFDSGLYSQSIEALMASSRLASFAKKESLEVSSEILALEADDFYIEGEENVSEEIRRQMMENLETVPPYVYMNSALFARRNGNAETEVQLLESLSSSFPDYLPGISALGEFSLGQIKKQEDELSKKLRNAGLKTVSMERQDKIPVIQFSSVLEKLNSLIEKDNMEALVLRDSLLSQKSRIDKTEKPVSDIWIMLEENASPQNTYPDSVVKHCVFSLMAAQLEPDAEALFDSYYKTKYNFSPAESPESLELWECELCAWFACKKADFKTGIALYKFIADKYGDRISVLNSSGKNTSVMNALVNLGVLYASVDRLPESLDSLGKASAKASTAKKKSEILFRIAELDWKLGDSYSAARSLKYALSLNPENNRARLLQKKIQAGK